MIISFGWTAEALLAGAKTCTRRDWADTYAQRFKEGQYHKAYDHLPRVHGKEVATIELTSDAYQENTRNIPDSDFEAEGFKWMEEHGLLMLGMLPGEFFDKWREAAVTLWVIRFRLVVLVRKPPQKVASFL